MWINSLAVGILAVAFGATAPSHGRIKTYCRDDSPQSASKNLLLRLEVAVRNEGGISHSTVDLATHVAAGIFRRIGVEIEWRPFAADGASDSAGPIDSERGAGLVVNLMSSSDGSVAAIPVEVVGLAAAGDSVSHILTRRIELAAIAARVPLADVLGHVIAHELGHVLLLPHFRLDGHLMSETVDPLQAARGVLWFNAREAATLRSQIVRLAGSGGDTP